ncbi:hypothetical protein LCGC14_0674170 [marine sediment metagenome]|uniref:Uncharacterized protein n=1 Tax=marine sediment metagenome TaxID=412755 RepID=A0A0F9QQ63_9ZZZZ
MAKNIASVHRLWALVAARLGTGKTVYLSVSQTRKLIEGLTRCADSVESESFCDSSFGILEVEAEKS